MAKNDPQHAPGRPWWRSVSQISKAAVKYSKPFQAYINLVDSTGILGFNIYKTVWANDNGGFLGKIFAEARILFRKREHFKLKTDVSRKIDQRLI